ncbi:MAG: hypothetical protein LBS48_01520 [Treponema sp.]|jgi:hypothetical protein|nr:hypothetical protein [Treponema sp.]
MSYANKNNSPYIEIETFLSFLEKHAKRMSEDQPEWLKWTQETAAKFRMELAALAEDGKCELFSDTEEGRIYLSHFYLDLLREYYSNMDANADLPFPSEESLGIEIPETQKKPLGVESDLPVYLADPQETDLPILRIGFPEDFGSALVLAGMVPRRLLEASLLKVRNYLRNHNNKEFALRKLTPQLMGKEAYLRDLLNQILIRPLDCYAAIEEGREFSYLFWAHFSILVKGDIRKKKDRLGDDTAAVQAVYILEAANSYYKALMVKRREREFALKNLEQHLNKPPYLYTLDQIIKFTSTKGVLLLSQYSEEDLEEWLKKQTTESPSDALPELLIVIGPDKERCFVSKSKLLLLCARLLGEGREKLKKAVSRRWVRLIQEYRSEAAMENDKEFEKLLSRYTAKLCPVLTAILEDPKLQLVYDEMEDAGAVPTASRIFIKGEMLPYSSLFLLKRKDLLEDAKLLLPFWYSMSVITGVIRFFKNLFRKRKEKLEGRNEDDEIEEPAAGKESSREIFTAAREIEFTMVPQGHSLDSYLAELETRWSRLINQQARANLVEDVNALVRDNLRRTLRVHRHFKITRENLAQLAAGIVNGTPSLRDLSGKESLRMYIELYMVKLLETVKF